ncbi:hypothetical protein PTTG_30462, partial [Puccinia triticina 1-1 BBBD Race 1]
LEPRDTAAPGRTTSPSGHPPARPAPTSSASSTPLKSPVKAAMADPPPPGPPDARPGPDEDIARIQRVIGALAAPTAAPDSPVAPPPAPALSDAVLALDTDAHLARFFARHTHALLRPPSPGLPGLPASPAARALARTIQTLQDDHPLFDDGFLRLCSRSLLGLQ